MDSTTFRRWLAERGCRFNSDRSDRGHGSGAVTVHHEGHVARLPLLGSHKPIDL